MRTFVAIPIPPEGPARRFLEACQDRLKQAGGDVRWTRPEQWHITLRFIGETTEGQRPALREAVQAAAAAVEPFEVRLEGWGVFPARGAPRVVWAGADNSARGIYDALAARLARAGFPAEAGPYRPHITLTRLKPRKDFAPLVNILKHGPPPPGAAFTATRVTLFESELSPRGSTYTPLLEATLGK